jgi:glyoxylase-like metal-dependent hydrolase (beta-lactamase superfamily II)
MRIYPLSEGNFSIDSTKVFKPFDTNISEVQIRPPGSILVQVQPFVVVTEQDIILLDTGLGYCNNQGILQIHANLMSIGIDPSSVTKVFLSHLHKDHSGGISYIHPQHQDRFISFPYANYYIQKREYEMALQSKSSSYISEQIQLLEDFSKVKWLTEDEGVIDDLIHYKITGGHSLYHQVCWIKAQDETLFYGADVAPQLQQMKSRFVAKYDLDGKMAMEWRQQWWEKGQKENWLFAFYHDTKVPTYKHSEFL